MAKPGRKPISPTERVQRKQQRDRNRYQAQKMQHMAENAIKGRDKTASQVKIRNIGQSKPDISLDTGTAAFTDALQQEGGEHSAFALKDRYAVYRRLLAIALVKIDDYCDKKTGRALLISELSPVAREAAQMEYDSGAIIAKPPRQQDQLRAINELSDILALSDLVKLAADKAAALLTERLAVNLVPPPPSYGAQLITNPALAAQDSGDGKPEEFKDL